MNFVKSFVLMLALVSAVACKKDYNNGKSDGTNQENARISALIKKAGDFNAMATGATIVKMGKDNNNFFVYRSGSSTFIAIDISNYVAGTNILTYISANQHFINLTDNGNGTYSCAAGCTTFGGGAATSSLVFEEVAAGSKDLEKTSALAESFLTQMMSETIVAKYGFSEERAYEVARLAQNFTKLTKSRSVTESDANAFSLEIMGSTFSEIEAAAQGAFTGDVRDMNSVIEKAAQTNGVSPEQMNQIVKELFI